MNQNWLSDLSSFGTTVYESDINAAHAADNTIQIMDRSDLSVVRFIGSDVNSFLQSQTCNDHAVVTEATAQLTGYCSPKGRLLALPHVLKGQDADEYFWLLPQAIVESVVKRLTMFVLRADVTIAVEKDWVVVGLQASNDSVNGFDATWLGEAKDEPMSVQVVGSCHRIAARSAEGVQRTLFLGPRDAVKTELQKCAQAAKEAKLDTVVCGSSSWHLGDVMAGVPSIGADTQDSFIPQMVNLQQIDGLSFTKGCYPGQEIVARMQYLGKLKRAMVRFSIPSEKTVKPGDTFSAGDDASAGEVVSAAVMNGRTELLAVVKTSADTANFSVDGEALTHEVLPYS